MSTQAVLSLAVLVFVLLIGPALVIYFAFDSRRSAARAAGDAHAAADPRSHRARQTLAAVIVALAAATAYYRFLTYHKLEQTAALFIGIPALLAVVVVFAARPVSLLGTICKAITLGLLIAGMFLDEGMICLLMAAPLFYAIGVLSGLLFDWLRHRRGGQIASGVLLLALVPMSFEGVTPDLSFAREERIVVEREVALSPREVARALALPPRFTGRLPLFLRFGFPRPAAVSGLGLAPGDRRTIHFAGGEGRPGDLVLEVTEAGPGRIRFHPLADGSKVAHWLAWEDAVVEWAPAGLGRTRVRWTQSFRRDLDPAWYFGPWERYAVRLAAEYLIESTAIPSDSRAVR